MTRYGNRVDLNRSHLESSKSKYVFRAKTFQSHIFSADTMYCDTLLVFPLVVNAWLMIAKQYTHGWKETVSCYVLAEPTSSTHRVTVVLLTMQAQVLSLIHI